MERKVLLYNSNDIKIGETFKRRAIQLVKQQRAVWIDDNKNAIRFASGMENMDTGITDSLEKLPVPINQIVTADDGSRLNDLIETRLNERKWFILHSISLIPGLVLLMIFSAVISEAVIELAWDHFYIYINDTISVFSIFCSIWMIAYLGHAYLFATNRHARKYITVKLSAEGTVQKINC